MEDSLSGIQTRELVELNEKLRREVLVREDMTGKLAAQEREILQLKSEKESDIVEKHALAEALRRVQVLEQVSRFHQS